LFITACIEKQCTRHLTLYEKIILSENLPQVSVIEKQPFIRFERIGQICTIVDATNCIPYWQETCITMRTFVHSATIWKSYKISYI